MPHVRNLIRLRLTLPALLCALALGCASDKPHGVDKCSDIPQGAIPQPNGTFACQWQHAQIAVAHQDHYMIYENEWYLGGKELDPFGQRHVAEIAAHIAETPCKVAIEPHFDPQRNAPDEALNRERVEAVAKRLAFNGVQDAFDRVIIAQPAAEGLYGEEAVRAGAQRLQGTGSGANSGGSSFGGPFGGTGSTAPVGESVGGGGTGLGGGYF